MALKLPIYPANKTALDLLSCETKTKTLNPFSLWERQKTLTTLSLWERGRGEGVLCRWVAAIVIATLSLSAHAVTAPVGATPGSFAVNAHGGATYTIPIAAPPGTAGMTPPIALRYDKQVRNDLVGLGWSIGGLSIYYPLRDHPCHRWGQRRGEFR